jgi:hypothetical protein
MYRGKHLRRVRLLAIFIVMPLPSSYLQEDNVPGAEQRTKTNAHLAQREHQGDNPHRLRLLKNIFKFLKAVSLSSYLLERSYFRVAQQLAWSSLRESRSRESFQRVFPGSSIQRVVPESRSRELYPMPNKKRRRE